jgi:hypothetical protein
MQYFANQWRYSLRSPQRERTRFLAHLHSDIRRIIESLSQCERPLDSDFTPLAPPVAVSELWFGFHEACNEIFDYAHSDYEVEDCRASTAWLRELERAVTAANLHELSSRYLLFVENLARMFLEEIKEIFAEFATSFVAKVRLAVLNQLSLTIYNRRKLRSTTKGIKHQHNKLLGLLCSSVYSCIERK